VDTDEELKTDKDGRRAGSIYVTYENKPVVFLTYHGFVTIASSSRIISLDY
jgi:hypothetical protein